MGLNLNTVYNEDCLDTMSRMSDTCIDLTVTSPPYDNLRKYDGYHFDFEKIAIELFRVMKNGGVVVWVVNDSTINGSKTLTSFKQALFFKDIGFNIHDVMIYQKTGISNPSNVRYHQIFEYMFILSKGKPKTFNPLKDRKNVYQKSRGGSLRTDKTRPRRAPVKPTEYGMRFNIWKYSNGGKGNISKDSFVHKHPAPFPEALARDHILSWSNISDIVYDPFIGSGTTAKMALETDRNFIGSEISSAYCDLANARIAASSKKFFQPHL